MSATRKQTTRRRSVGGNIWLSHDPDEVPIVRELPEDLHTPPPDYFPLDQRTTFMGYRRADGRVGTRNLVLIVPASMCASHEALQISTIAEFTLYDRMSFRTSTAWWRFRTTRVAAVRTETMIDVMLRTLSNYADPAFKRRKALANSSPGFEHSENPGNRNLSFKNNAESVGESARSLRQLLRSWLLSFLVTQG